MKYQCTLPLTELEGRTDFINSSKNHECVALVQRASGGCSNAPATSQWRKGKKVMDASMGDIPLGTVIATFDSNGKYPATQRHAAIYFSHDSSGIWVYHQYKIGRGPIGGKVHKYKIRNKGSAIFDHMDAANYYTVD